MIPDETDADRQQHPQKWQQHIQTLTAHASFRNFEYTQPRAEGDSRVFRQSGKPIFNAQKEFQGYRGVITDITEFHQLTEQLNHQATHDELTGLANRREFTHRLNQALERAKKDHGDSRTVLHGLGSIQNRERYRRPRGRR